uniref:hAT-like transposase RNase-H fold domain-containing protein n=1 Tax=Lactuca sativa TaxID=4236 RepID=A0A9R1UN95_LACSA|nr:hypothetical protein LSAT_V11C800442180 [Lactuca sativa]
MQATITKMTLSQVEQKKNMAISIKAKYGKYLDNVDNVSYLLYVAVVLDPHNKLGYVTYCIELIYGKGSEKSKKILGLVTKTLEDMFNHYKGKVEKANVQNTHDNLVSENLSSFGEMDIDLELEFDKFDHEGQDIKSEVEIYLADGREKGTTSLIFWDGGYKNRNFGFRFRFGVKTAPNRTMLTPNK